MNIRPIRNEADYGWALAEIEQYFENEPLEGSPEADRFDVLATLIEAYEQEHWPIDVTMTPLEALREFMALTDRTQSDLARLLGHRSRASDILLGKRKLTVEMMGKLVREWRMPAELLIGDSTSPGKAA
jgi:HTH-type transcriptional regulator/antitoxin HigA